MKRIEFVNGQAPYLNDQNLNQMQENMEEVSVPSGGRIGQILAKASNTDNDVEWIDYTGGVTGDTLPIGTIVEYGGDTFPENWLICDGSAVSRTTYSALFARIGTSYGAGDGSTTFNLPDFKGRVGVGLDSTQTEFDTLGETGGEKTHTLTVDEMPSHNHGIKINTPSSVQAYSSGTPIWPMLNDNTVHKSTEITGGGQPHNILQPYIVTNYIIKAYQSAGLVATVVDNLSSTSSTDALSAKQGKIIGEKLNNMITVILSANQSNTDGESTVAFDTVNYLLGNAFTLQNDGGIKCNVTCDIEINATIRFGYSSASTKELLVYKNSDLIRNLSQQNITANTQTLSTFCLSVAANDVIYLKGKTVGEERSSFVYTGTHLSIKRIN